MFVTFRVTLRARYAALVDEAAGYRAGPVKDDPYGIRLVALQHDHPTDRALLLEE